MIHAKSFQTNFMKCFLTNETFGAAFTAAEGQRLIGMEAGIGKSPEANKRLLGNALKMAERAAERGMKRAAASGDFETALEIQNALKFDIGDIPQGNRRVFNPQTGRIE